MESLDLYEQFLMVVLVFVLSAFLVGPMYFPWWRRRGWVNVAKDLEMSCDDDSYLLEGERYGVPVVVRVVEETRGSSKQRLTQYSVPLGGRGVPPMRLQPEHRLLGIELDSMLKKTELEVGFDMLDDAFIINGEDKEAIAEFFRRSGVGSALLRCVKNVRGRLTYQKGALQVSHEGVAGEKKLRANIEELTRCGSALAKAGEAYLAERQEAHQEAASAKFGV